MPAYNLLAIETSTERLSLAIQRSDRLFACEVDAGQRHSELALPMMHALLDEAALTLSDLDVIAFGQGPGSFTGVRIACGLTQGLALGLGKRVMPVATQMALAEQCGAEKVIVALDARMGEIYFAAYERSQDATGWSAVVAPMLVKPDKLPAIAGELWCGIGSAFDVPTLMPHLSARYGAPLGRIVTNALPGAREVAIIAARQIAQFGLNIALEPEFAAPLYLRNKVAMTIAERAEQKMKRVSA